MDTLPISKKKVNHGHLGPNEFILLIPEIKELIVSKDFNQLKGILKNIHSIDIAEGWHNLERQEKIIIFKLLSFKKAVEVFEDLVLAEQSYLLNNLESNEAVSVLDGMAPDERARLFKELPPKVNKKLLLVMKKEAAEDVRQLLTFKENSAGSIMTTEFVSLRKDMTARQALLRIQENQKAATAKNIYSVYVTDDERHLLGMIGLQTLLAAPPDITLKDIILDSEFIKVNINTPKEEVATQFSRYDLLDAPVVNEQSQLLGIVTIDDIVDIIQRQNTAQIYEIGKMEPARGEEIRYARATVGELLRRRAGWLILLLIFDFLTGTVLKTFEHSLSTLVALAFFIPMLLDTGGNAGAQTSITIIRSLAIGDVSFKNVWRVAKLETTTALFMGAIVGAVAFLRAVMLQKDFILAAVVGSTMFFIILLAIFTGISLPFLSKRVGLDPAVLAGPITTSIIDVVGLIIYFKIAQLFLPILR